MSNTGTFLNIIGQERIKNLLFTSWKRERLAHAYLFHGQAGVGKDAMGIAMAMGLNCSEAEFSVCGECSSCHRIQSLEHNGFHLILPTPTRPSKIKQGTYYDILRERALQRVENPYREILYAPELTIMPIIGIDRIRELKKQFMLKVSGGGFRTILISHADRMTVAASNSLLKLLEEPPPKTVIILTTSFPGNLLGTIISRCQSIRFDPLNQEEIENALIQKWSVPRERAEFSARICGGSLDRGLQYADESWGILREGALSFLENILHPDKSQYIASMDSLAGMKEKQNVIHILQMLLLWLRDLSFLQLGQREFLMNTDQIESLQRFNEKWPQFNVFKGMRNVERAIDFIGKNVYLSLIIYSLGLELRRCGASNR